MGHRATILAAIFVFALAVPVADSNAQGVAIHSFQDTSCGAWVASHSEPAMRAQYLYWFRGFVSGFNYANTRREVPLEAMPDLSTLALYIDKYCREYPLKPFVGAAFTLVEELAAKKFR